MIDDLLSKLGLKYENLNVAEKETLNQWLDLLSSKNLTVDDIKLYIRQMIYSVEQELTEVKHDSKQDLFLKARLRNYFLLEAFLETPEKAKRALESMLSRMGSKGAK